LTQDASLLLSIFDLLLYLDTILLVIAYNLGNLWRRLVLPKRVSN
jgi:hypothetical protein